MKSFSNLFRIFFTILSSDKDFVYKTKRLTGFYPLNRSLYKLAFKHRSAQITANNEKQSDNERLEYLGDAILGAIVAHVLFKKYPYKDEGFLTEMRSKIVNRENLNKLAIKIGVDSFVEGWPEHKSKSIYGDAFEALIGAIYLDRGYNITKKFIVNRILKYHIDIEELEIIELNFKGKLIDWGQKEKKEVKFELLEEIGDGYAKKYKILVIIDGKNYEEAMDFSKKKAEQKAAEKTLLTLEEKNILKHN